MFCYVISNVKDYELRINLTKYYRRSQWLNNDKKGESDIVRYLMWKINKSRVQYLILKKILKSFIMFQKDI